jgi:hypothetical protein
MSKKKRKFYLTEVIVRVLSEDRPAEFENLSDLEYLITDGECSGTIAVKSTKKLTGKQAAKELQKQGSDPEFFRLDEDGNDLED